MVCFYAASDIHTDMKENMELMRGWPERPDDVLLLAGDISNNPAVFRETLELARAKFGTVFFCPGNHDLWLHKDDACKDSVGKLEAIQALCRKLDIRVRPGSVHGVTVVPLHSWYHADFDADPDVEDESLAPVEKVMMDFHACKWPEGLTPAGGSDSIARFMDGLNDEPLDLLDWLLPPPGSRTGPVISFSHFLPRRELLPEKRTLFYPPLPKAVGSLPLGERVQQLKPDMHVFGHTHYAWAAELDGTRFVQACMAYPRERVERAFSVNCSAASGEEVVPPVLVYDHAQRAFPAYRGFWSEYYKVHARRPEDVAWIYGGKKKKDVVLSALRRVVGAGKEHVSVATLFPAA